MKNLICILLFALIFSCEKDENLENNIRQNNIELNEDFSKKVKFHIYYADWDEWGRAIKDCGGWGLCNYVDCWFCCTEDGIIVDCNSGESIGSAGIIEINELTKTGFLYIELDPTVPVENDAIVNQKDFHIDNDIINS